MRSKTNKRSGKGKDGRSERSSSRRGEASSKRDSAPRGGSSSRRESSRRDTSGRKGGRDKSAKAIVLEMFSNSPDTVFTQRQLTRRLSIVDKKGREQLRTILDALVRENKLLLVDEDKFMLNLRVNIITGRVDLANSKYAYIVSEETEEDVRVFREHLKYAMDGD
ncbi:MAG: ribonuclease R, partial [Hymenobacteraceae bacterium]|nr:ribonuclease R [Hymenobacteraceae bacterium]